MTAGSTARDSSISAPELIDFPVVDGMVQSMGMDATPRFQLVGELRGEYDQQICAQVDATDSEVIEWANLNAPPTGQGARRWRLASVELDGPDLAGPNPALCIDDPQRRHWLLYA